LRSKEEKIDKDSVRIIEKVGGGIFVKQFSKASNSFGSKGTFTYKVWVR
jgi:hypothetical protein